MGSVFRLRMVACSAGILATLFLCAPIHAQQLAKRLILKDGSYQLVTKYEVKGDRVRYYSAERGEWEEVPNSLVDWAATEKYEKDRAAGIASPEAAEMDKELEAERRADEARSPHVAPGLRLPDEGGVLLLDNFQGQPQLDEIPQSGGKVNKNMKGNILRAAINPIASAKQTVELPGAHASIQAHVTQPTLFVNLAPEDASADQSSPSTPDQQSPDSERFKIVRMQAREDKRVVGAIKIAVYGKVSQQENLVPTHSEIMPGSSWIKITPTSPLATGEYAVVEMLGKQGMNLYVWDFGINPAAPANRDAWKPDPSASQQPSQERKQLRPRQ